MVIVHDIYRTLNIPKMATIDLILIYENIFLKKVPHCALCYRSNAEVGLVKSQVFKKVVKAMNYSKAFMKNDNLCYLCHARMVTVAEMVDTLYLVLEVQRVMRAYMSHKYSNYNIVRNLRLRQKGFADFRRKMQLHQTEITVLDSFNKFDKPPATPGPIDNSNLDEARPALSWPLNSHIYPIIQKIETILTDMVPGEKIKVEFDTASLPQLNPIGIPSDSLEPTDKVITKNKLDMEPKLTIDGSSGLTQICFQTDISIAPEQNLNKIPIEDFNMSKKTAKYSVLPTIVDCRTDNDAFKEEILLGDTEMVVIQQPAPEVVKFPIRVGSEVDWEDKIPTEVISFVNATCPICKLEMDKVTLKDHFINAHINPDVVYTCDKCFKNFKSKSTLNEHVQYVHESIKVNIHTKDDQVICTKCGKLLKNHLSLNKHMKRSHQPESSCVNCPKCGKYFKTRGHVLQHIQVMHNNT